MKRIFKILLVFVLSFGVFVSLGTDVSAKENKVQYYSTNTRVLKKFVIKKNKLTLSGKYRFNKGYMKLDKDYVNFTRTGKKQKVINGKRTFKLDKKCKYLYLSGEGLMKQKPQELVEVYDDEKNYEKTASKDLSWVRNTIDLVVKNGKVTYVVIFFAEMSSSEI